MNPWLITRRLFPILLGLACTTSAPAHVVEQFYAELHDSSLEVLFDVGYAKPAWRGDPDEPAPTRDWLTSLSVAEHASLKSETERYLRDHLTFSVDDQPLDVTYAFPDFDNNPPDFPRLLTNGAYYRVVIQPQTDTPYQLHLNKNFPNLVIKLPDGNDSAYLTINPGQSTPLGSKTPSDQALPSHQHALVEGYLHVIPAGLDHILFILAIFFGRRAWRPLLWQSLGFTMAHTLTLGLTASGILVITGNWVEPAIALSIAVLAIENLFLKKIKPWRHALIFGFGLIHGMGFATALAPVLGSDDGFLGRLVMANLGVEIAQVCVLAAAWIITLRMPNLHESKLRKIANLTLAAVALFWFVERVIPL